MPANKNQNMTNLFAIVTWQKCGIDIRTLIHTAVTVRLDVVLLFVVSRMETGFFYNFLEEMFCCLQNCVKI